MTYVYPYLWTYYNDFDFLTESQVDHIVDLYYKDHSVRQHFLDIYVYYLEDEFYEKTCLFFKWIGYKEIKPFFEFLDVRVSREWIEQTAEALKEGLMHEFEEFNKYIEDITTFRSGYIPRYDYKDIVNDKVRFVSTFLQFLTEDGVVTARAVHEWLSHYIEL